MPTELPSGPHSLRPPGSMQLDTDAEGVPTDETARLIATRKVEGTPVFDRAGERLGEIVAVMVEKQTGIVAYVVLGSGGFLGLGETHRPLPWRALTYDVELGGYVIDDGAMTDNPAAADIGDAGPIAAPDGATGP
jgi:PRC-barrel domain